MIYNNQSAWQFTENEYSSLPDTSFTKTELSARNFGK